jgi:hypothetical protein
MTIEADEEHDLSPSPPWPVRAARFLEQRPRISVVSAVLIAAVVASLTTQLRPADPPVSAPTAAAPSTTPVEYIALGGVAYQQTAARPGLSYDLMFSVTAGPFTPSGGGRLTYVYRLGVARGTTDLVAARSADQRDAQVFADPRGELMLVASQSDLSLLNRDGSTVSSGPPLDVVSALFVEDDNRVSLIIATTSESVVDVTHPDRPRVVANVGGTLFGRLDDGRLALASPTPAERVVLAVGLDGSLTELGRITGARGPPALQRFPTPTSAFRVLALRDLDPGSPGGQAITALDLSTGAVTDLQVLGFDGTFAPETNRPGAYVFTQPGEQRISGRGTQNIEVPSGRFPFLDPLRSWSPDGALIAFRAAGGTGDRGLTALTRDGRLIVDLVPQIGATVQLIGWVLRQ